MRYHCARAAIAALFAAGAIFAAGPASARSLADDGAAAPAAGGPPAPSHQADTDGDGLADGLQARLAAMAPDERVDVVVTFSGPGSAASAQRAVGPFDVRREFSLIAGFAATMTAAQVRGLARTPGVFRVEENFQVSTRLEPSTRDHGVSENQAIAAVDPGDPRADGARESFGVTGAGVEVCIVDTGLDAGHVRLDGQVVGFVDCVDETCDPVPAFDDHGHGTHVASIAAGRLIDWLGDGTPAPEEDPLEGVAYDADISGAKVLNAQGSGSEAAVIAGVEWCSNRGADLISMSLGAGTCGDGGSALSQASDAAVAAGSVVTAAAGNSGAGECTVGSPGDAHDVVTVGASAEHSGDPGTVNFSEGVFLTWFSSRGPTGEPGNNTRTKPDVTAPGLSVLAADAGTTDGYAAFSGTSMATPFVAGVAALVRQANPALTALEVKAILECTARDYGLPGDDNDFGAGLVDAYAAAAAAVDGDLADCAPTAAEQTPFPVREHVAGEVPDFGQWSHQFEVTEADLGHPVAAIVTIDGEASCSLRWFGGCLIWEYSPDLDVELYHVQGGGRTLLDESTCLADGEGKCGGVGRQETLSYLPSTAGIYEVVAYAVQDSVNEGKGGPLWLDLSYGALAMAAGGGDSDSPPSVSITSPAEGATVSGSSVAIAADASDDVGVDQVEFFVDGGSIGADTEISDGWSVSWDSTSVGDGSHDLTAEATDTADQTTTSAAVSVTVDNGADSLSLSGITPDTMQAGTSVDATISGTGFAAGAAVALENGSGPAPSVSNVVVADSDTITATITAKSGGPPRNRLWDLVVSNPDGSSVLKADAFTVTP